MVLPELEGASNHIVASGGRVTTAEYAKLFAGTSSSVFLFTSPKPPLQTYSLPALHQMLDLADLGTAPIVFANDEEKFLRK